MRHLPTKELTPGEERGRYLLGVLGGMGPLASAEFLKTIYECSVTDGEQRSPSVVMYSDPTFPDRTEALLGGSQQDLLERLAEALDVLCGWNVSEVVICCITIHHLLPELPPRLRRKVTSLLDPIMERACEIRTRQLMLCTNGARQLNIFERHAGWERAGRYIVLPEEDDQQRVHALIYEIKRSGDLQSMSAVLEGLLVKYRVDGFIAGCTEVHLLSKRFMSSPENRRRYQCTDPLLIIAQRLPGGRIRHQCA
jgi:aspartate racemase